MSESSDKQIRRSKQNNTEQDQDDQYDQYDQDKPKRSKKHAKYSFKNKKSVEEMHEEAFEWMEQFTKNSNDVYISHHDNKNLPWVEKFRPHNLDSLVSHSIIVDILKKFIKSHQMPHMLFSGPPGTGKTSTIIACAKEMYGDNYSIMVLEINASEERGIEVVRNKIKDFIMAKGVFLDKKSDMYKLVILDEADAMTTDAQAMLTSVIEKYSINVRFCLICNYIKKISVPIQSRCTQFKFLPLSKKHITEKLKDVSKDLGLNITDDGISAIVKISRGDMRRVFNVAQATHMAYNLINEHNVIKCTGYPNCAHVNMIYDCMTNDKFSIAYTKICEIISKEGYSLSDIITEITEIVIDKYMKGKIKDNQFINIITNLKNIEINLTLCPNESIQIAGLVSIFTLAK